MMVNGGEYLLLKVSRVLKERIHPSLAFEGIFQADVEGMMSSQSPRCTLVLSSGVVHSVADGLPSQPVDFGSYFFKLKDNGCGAWVAGWVQLQTIQSKFGLRFQDFSPYFWNPLDVFLGY